MFNEVERPLWLDGNRHEMVYWVVSGLPVTIFSNHFGPDTFDYLNWHWHEELQFAYSLTGDICVQVGDVTYDVKEGEALLINSCQMHRICRKSERATYICLDIADSFPCSNSDYSLYKRYKDPVIGAAGKPAYKLTPLNPNQANALQIIEEMWEVFQTKEFGYELRLWSMLLELWYQFICSIPDRTEVPETEDETVRLRRIISYIRREYANQITLSDVADSVFLSKSECCRFFKKMMDCSIFEYLLRYRIDKSAEFLTQTNKKISVIAAETGFSSQSYFTECFKKQLGMTPKQYRFMRQGKENEKVSEDK